MQIDLSDLKVGDKAYSAQYGAGKMESYSDDGVYIKFNNGDCYGFSFSGFHYESDAHPTLFHSKQEWLEYVQWACRERKYVLAKDLNDKFKAGCKVELTDEFLFVLNKDSDCKIFGYLEIEPKEDAIDRLIKAGWIKEVE